MNIREYLSEQSNVEKSPYYKRYRKLMTELSFLGLDLRNPDVGVRGEIRINFPGKWKGYTLNITDEISVLKNNKETVFIHSNENIDNAVDKLLSYFESE